MKRFLTSLGLLAVIPFFISRRSRVARSTWIAADPAGIFPFINELRNWPLWTEWNRRKVAGYYEGPESGVGAVHHWATVRTDGTLSISASVLDRRVSYVLEMQDGQRHIEGAINLEPVGGGTRVTWACWWLGDGNPYARYFDLILRFWAGHDFAAGLRNLKRLCESSRQREAV